MFKQLIVLALLLGIVLSFGFDAANANTNISAKVTHSCLKKNNAICRKILVLRPGIDLDEALELSNAFYSKAKKYRLDADLLLSIAYQESSLKLETVRYISGIQLVDGKYEEVKIGSDFCMMQINSSNILSMKLDTEKLLNDASYCIDAGARILANFKRLYHKVDPMWWTRYNANTKEHREKYQGHIERHMVKLETRKPDVERIAKRIQLEKKKEEMEKIARAKELERIESEKIVEKEDVDFEKIITADKNLYIAKNNHRETSDLSLEDFTNLSLE